MPKKITAGLASFGMSGKVFHGPLLAHHDRFHLRRIVQRSGDDAHTLYPDAIVSRSLDELVNDGDIDLIVVNLPDRHHFELAKRCLESGKHVVIEKPITETFAQAEELIRLAERQKKMLTVFQNRRWDGDFMTVSKVVKSSALGRIVEFESHYDRYRNFIQPNTWKERLADGTGIVYNLGSHMIDQALVLFGMPEAVTAHLRIVRTGGEVDDWYDIRLHYTELTVLLRASYLVKDPGPRYVVHGTNGTFTKSGLDPQEEELKQGGTPRSVGWGSETMEWFGMLVTEKDGETKRSRVQTLAGDYSAFYDGVADCLEHGGAAPVPGIEAANVVRVIEAVFESNRKKSTVPLNRER